MNFPDCRTDDVYNEKYLNQSDSDFIRGYDQAIKIVQRLFANLECYPDLEQLLDDNVAIIKANKTDMVQTCIEDWAEMSRDEIITVMIDTMDKVEYQEIKARVDKDGAKDGKSTD